MAQRQVGEGVFSIYPNLLVGADSKLKSDLQLDIPVADATNAYITLEHFEDVSSCVPYIQYVHTVRTYTRVQNPTYVRMYVHLYIRTYIQYVFMHALDHVCTYCMCTCIYVCTYMYTTHVYTVHTVRRDVHIRRLMC